MQIVVLGMHRSGTSSVTNLLHDAGAYFGPIDVSTGTSWENPRGFWERRDMRRVCDHVLQQSGYDWWKVDRFTTEAIPSIIRMEAEHQFASIVAELDEHRPWVVKEPRLCLLMPVFRAALGEPLIVFVMRHPWEVARSLKFRNGIPEDVGLALWHRYMSDALTATSDLPTCLVDYNKLVIDPEAEIAALINDLSRISGSRCPLSAENAHGAIDAKLRRQLHSDAHPHISASPAMVLYEALRSDGLQAAASAVADTNSAALRVFEGLGGLPSLRRLTEKDRSEAILGRIEQDAAATRKELDRTNERLERSEKALRASRKEVKEQAAQLKRTNGADLQRITRLLSDQMVGLRQEKKELQYKLTRKERKLNERERKLKERERTLKAIRSSRTWRFGAPFRLGGRFARSLLKGREPIVRETRPKSPVTKAESPIDPPPATAAEMQLQTAVEKPRADVDIIIPVHNALEDTKRCLTAVRRHQEKFNLRIIVVNDASDEETTKWLKRKCQITANFELINLQRNEGYTRAVNRGLKTSNASYVIALNSDTIPTKGWLSSLVDCAESDRKIGIVGPLSNAATWQSIPEIRFTGVPGFAINSLPAGVNPDQMAMLVKSCSTRSHPRTTFVNGFCYLIKRSVIDTIGYFDEENFPVGYGEENDYSIRTKDAGYELAIADDAYVYHAKSKSFGQERRKALSSEGMGRLKAKHGENRVDTLIYSLNKSAPLDPLRRKLKRTLEDQLDSRGEWFAEHPARILFLLPARGGGGGAHSIVQEAAEMRRKGVFVSIALRENDLKRYREVYAGLPEAADLFVGCTFEEFELIAVHYDVVVATIYSSVELMARLIEAHPHLIPAYYIQDYEPFFFGACEEKRVQAEASYTRLPGTVAFAKTQWLIDTVEARHPIRVQKVSPSIDHSVYRPAPARQSQKDRLQVCAMLRPRTPRRGAARTIRVLRSLKERFGERISLHTFGCAPNDSPFLELERDFEFEHHGICTREEVAAILAGADLFLDLSDYQAFGRTALEAMACGATAVVPAQGGASVYAIDDVNALVIDTSDEASITSRVIDLLASSDRLHAMQREALSTAAQYSTEAAATSEIDVIERAFRERQHLQSSGGLPPPIDGDLTVFTVASQNYEIYVLPYAASVLFSNPTAVVEIALDNPEAFQARNPEALAILERYFPRRLVLTKNNLTKIGRKAVPASSARFLIEPRTYRPFVYLGDIDILVLFDIVEVHLENMARTGLPFSNIQRPGLERLSGLHFSQWDAYYPVVGFPEDFNIRSDEALLYSLVEAKKRGMPDPKDIFRPTLGYHLSANRDPRTHPAWSGLGNISYFERYRRLAATDVWQELVPSLDARYRFIIGIVESLLMTQHGINRAEFTPTPGSGFKEALADLQAR